MVAKKKVLIVGVFLALMVGFFSGCTGSPIEESTGNNTEVQREENIIKIGISQIVEHPALDDSRKGFIDALQEAGYKEGENIEIEFQSAQGEMATAQTIASSFVSTEKDLILAIATPAAQAAYNTTKEIPILITAVTDPLESGLVNSWEKTGTNVTGTSDMTPIRKQLELLKQLVPSAMKVGVLYNTSESNSEIQLRMVEENAPELSLEVEKVGVTTVNEIPQATQELLSKVDVVYIPTDNLIASAMPLIVNESMKKNIPIIGSEKAHVEAGALATNGLDYYKLGFQTGLMAIEVIKGKSPEDMSIETLKEAQLVINEDSASKLQIDVPNDLLKSALLVKDGE